LARESLRSFAAETDGACVGLALQVGVIIGKMGSMIDHLEKMTGAKISVAREDLPGTD
jgi:rRNA processing protein Krr1/Pno1